MIYGLDSAQYKLVWDYGATVKIRNPGSSVFITLGDIETPPSYFQKMYMCLKACKQGFVSGCRPIVGLDGCHLKGLYPGVLLTAVWKDSNSNIFPLAWAVVEIENKENWTWFLQLLVDDIESVAREGTYIKHKDQVAFISDRQKGLLKAFNIVTSQAELRFCARHIWANFSKTYHGAEYKQLFWRAARAYTRREFLTTMESIQGMSSGAFAYLNAIPPKHWSRHAFNTHTKSGILVNKCSESFNNVLRKCRDKPILTLMEWIRNYVMNKMFSRVQLLKKHNGSIMKIATKALSFAKIECRGYQVNQSALNMFEVDCKGTENERRIVDLAKRSCDCFKWDLTGIPCSHAYICIALKKREDLVTYVDIAYSRDLYQRAYSTPVNPLPDINDWERTPHDQPQPPPYRKMPGRPSLKKRKKDANEMANARSTKKKSAICSNCGIDGHIIRSCKNVGVRKKRKKTLVQCVSQPEISCTNTQPRSSQDQSQATV